MNDVVSDAMRSISAAWPRIRAGESIEDIEAYSRETARRAFWNWLKAARPHRYRLRLRVRSALQKDERLAEWNWGRDRVAGRRLHAGRRPTFNRKVEQMCLQPERAEQSCFGRGSARELPTGEILFKVFRWVPGAVEMHATIGFAIHCLGASDLEKAEWPEGFEPSASAGQHQESTAKAILREVWEELKAGPPDSAGVFLAYEGLGSGSDSLLTILASQGLVDLSEAAEAIGLPLPIVCGLISQPCKGFQEAGALYGHSADRARYLRAAMVDRVQRRLARCGLAPRREGTS
jgi:hypothetical protein